MKYFLLLILTISLSFAQDVQDIYSKASKYEEEGNYKEAMLLYKQALSQKISKEDEYILDLSKSETHKVQTFTKMKRDFYTNINKATDNETNISLEQMITNIQQAELLRY